MTTTLTITRGIPASGKTAWAKAWVAESPGTRARVNRDDLRTMLFNHTTGRLTHAQETAVTVAQQAAVKALLRAGVDVVADDMNVRPKYVRQWRKFADLNGAGFDIIEFPMDPAEAITRDAQREHPVGEETIRTIVQKFTRKGHLLAIPDEETDLTPWLYEPPADAPTAVIVDIDGTVAIMADRSPYDLTRVHEDSPNAPVIDVVNTARRAGHQIVFCSGREDSSRQVTEEWLASHVGRNPNEPLYMRPSDDKRRDSIVKRELFDTHIRNHYNVVYVLDDRQQVVDMWRALGLTVLQVAPGDF